MTEASLSHQTQPYMHLLSVLLSTVTTVVSAVTRSPTQTPTPVSRQRSHFAPPPLNDDNIRPAVNSHLSGDKTAYGPISTWDTSRVTNMAVLFYGDPNFDEDLSSWDVSSVTDMNSMFYMNTYFNSDISEWDVANVKDMFTMFFGCSAFNQPIGEWDTSKVTNMSGMMTFAESFNRDLSGWDLSKVSNLDHVLYGASSFTQDLCLNIPTDASKLDPMIGSQGSLLEFPQCFPFEDGNIKQAVEDFVGGSTNYAQISKWDTSRVTNMRELFYEAFTFNENLSTWDVSNVTTMQDMFYYAQDFNSDISSWNTSQVTNMKGMFGGAWSFSADISTWNVQQVNNMYAMFMNSKSFNMNINNWDVSNVTDMRLMFNSATTLEQSFCWDTTKTNTADMFSSSKGGLQSYPKCVPFDDQSIRAVVRSNNFDDIEDWDVSQVTDMKELFTQVGTGDFNFNLNSWDVSSVTTMEDMFFGVESFDSNLNQWDVSSVTNMRGMFARGTFNSGIGQWDVSNVEQMQYMFMNNKEFAIDIHNWDVSKVTDMDYMFYGASSFKDDLCWKVSKASMTGVMEGSQGSFVHCKTSPNEPTTSAPTQRPSPRTRAPTPTPTRSKTVSPTPNGTMGPTPRPINGTKMPTISPIRQVTAPPTPAPTNKPTGLPITVPQTPLPTRSAVDWTVKGGEFHITSGLSSSNQNWCLYAANNAVLPKTVLAIEKCSAWSSFKWTVDYEGKIRNYKDPNLCVTMTGYRVSLETCVNGFIRQKWIYNSNDRRLLSFFNGLKALTVEAGVAATKAQVKSLFYGSTVHDSEIWNVQFDTEFGSPNGHLFVPNYNTFRIVSHISHQSPHSYCLFPANNSPVNGMHMGIGQCKTWKTYLWMWDSMGKLLNVKDPTKCIEGYGMRLQIGNCDDRSKAQRFAYSVLDKKLISLRYGRKEAVVSNPLGATYQNAQVKFSILNRDTALLENQWTLEQF